MDIKTKFKPGDEIFLLDKEGEDKWKLVFDHVWPIYHIFINVRHTGEAQIMYELKDNGWTIIEEDCFLTKEEAEAECKRRNEAAA